MSSAETTETMTLNNALETTAFRNAGNIDSFSNAKSTDGNYIADLEFRGIFSAEFSNESRSNSSFFEMTALRLIYILFLADSES